MKINKVRQFLFKLQSRSNYQWKWHYVFQLIYTTIIASIQKQKPLGKYSGWITDSVIDHTISISKYDPLPESSYIKLPKELYYPRKGLINIQNIDDNECFKWSMVRYLSPADRKPAKIIKADKEFAKKLDYKDIKFPVKIRDICKIEKKIPLALVLLIMEIKKSIRSKYQINDLR